MINLSAQLVMGTTLDVQDMGKTGHTYVPALHKAASRTVIMVILKPMPQFLF